MSNQKEEERILLGFRSGNNRSSKVVLSWITQVIRARSYNLSEQDREDLINESAYHVFKHVSQPGFSVKGNARALVRKIAQMRCIDFWRKKMIPQGDSEGSTGEWPKQFREVPATPDQIEALRDNEPDPFEWSTGKDERKRICLAYRKLSPKCQEILKRVIFYGLPYGEITVQTGVKEGALRNLKSDCWKRYQNELDRLNRIAERITFHPPRRRNPPSSRGGC